jgi:3-isopropylmalate/(R)-2-methylmalate dehydratase small subunit
MALVQLRGRALPLGDDISTDILHPPEFFSLDPVKVRRGFLAKHDPTVAEWFKPGDVIVAGRNFGCGSSREAVVRCLALNGVGAIVALSFARIFFRTCVNLGIPCLRLKDGPIVPPIARGELLSICLEDCVITRQDGSVFSLDSLPPFLAALRERGGILGLLP